MIRHYCATCQWFAPRGNIGSGPPVVGVKDYSACRLHPSWEEREPDDWCGHHSALQNRDHRLRLAGQAMPIAVETVAEPMRKLMASWSGREELEDKRRQVRELFAEDCLAVADAILAKEGEGGVEKAPSGS